MVLQHKKGSICEDHQTHIPHMRPWSHGEMGGGFLGDLLPCGQLDVCQVHAYYDNPQIDPHQVSRFCSGLHPG